MKIKKIAAFIYLFSLGTFSQRADAEINYFDDKFITVRTFLDTPSYQFDIQSKVGNYEVIWQPNIRVLTGVDFSINDFIGAGIGWANNVAAQPGIVEGNTTYIDYRLGLSLHSFHIDANYQSYQGFYVSNTSQVDPATASTGVDLQDPNMVATNISLNGTFILNPDNFSYAAVVGQNERQEKTGGSVLLGLAASDTNFSSSQYLIPPSVRSHFGQDQNIKNAAFYSLSAKVGVGFTIAWTERWFTSLVFDAGLGGEFRSYGDGVNATQSGGGTTKLDGVFSFGYNGDSFLAAFIFSGDDTTYTTESLVIPAILGDAKFALGAHF